MRYTRVPYNDNMFDNLRLIIQTECQPHGILSRQLNYIYTIYGVWVCNKYSLLLLLYTGQGFAV